ncbi:MAG: hypothetical protein LBN01_01105 [Endomicrobium sp.]|nr:hypothetical protein [Endomicrobium sp.]
MQKLGDILECGTTIKTLKRERIDIFTLRFKEDTDNVSKMIEKLILPLRIILIYSL